MIGFLMLASALQPETGTTFTCGGVSVATAADIGAPATEGGRMFLVGSAGGGTALEAIVDRLPVALVVSWRREHNSPVVLEIGDIDRRAGIAAYTLRSERNPASRLFTPVETRGTCTLRAGATVTQDIRQ